MSGYTKGPWEWWTSNSFLRLSSKATGKDGGVIDSYVMSDGHSSLSVTYADMALIAAAPEILEALIRLESWATAMHGGGVIYTGDHPIAQAKEAVSKALGRT